jgi:hypothetical protein
MADDIVPGSEEFSKAYLKPSVDEEVNALWGRKMAANDGVFAGSLVDTQLGHVKFMQGTLFIEQSAECTAYLTEDGADGGVAVFDFMPIMDIKFWKDNPATIPVEGGSGWLGWSFWGSSFAPYGAYGRLDNGTMLIIYRESLCLWGTYVWTCIGI